MIIYFYVRASWFSSLNLSVNSVLPPPPQYKDAFMKANPGYKWCPTTSKPVKSPTCQAVCSQRKKVWCFSSNSSKDSATAKKTPQTDNMPQLNFAMAGEYTRQQKHRHEGHWSFQRWFCVCCDSFSDPTKMGGLSMLLLAGEHALTTREVGDGPATAACVHQVSSEAFWRNPMLSGFLVSDV